MAYYVDSVAGDDLNDGLSDTTPLRTLARLQQFASGDISTYYVDPGVGSDLNDGQTIATAWGTTAPADLVALSPWMSVSYKLDGVWSLYRAPDMTMNLWVMPMNLVTNRMNNF